MNNFFRQFLFKITRSEFHSRCQQYSYFLCLCHNSNTHNSNKHFTGQYFVFSFRILALLDSSLFNLIQQDQQYKERMLFWYTSSQVNTNIHNFLLSYKNYQHSNHGTKRLKTLFTIIQSSIQPHNNIYLCVIQYYQGKTEIIL